MVMMVKVWLFESSKEHEFIYVLNFCAAWDLNRLGHSLSFDKGSLYLVYQNNIDNLCGKNLADNIFY